MTEAERNAAIQNEQRRRAQILKLRNEQAGPTPPAPSMSDAEAAIIDSRRGAPTQDQVIAAAMLAKMVQGNINEVKKLGTDRTFSEKMTNVDMSKVMPSGIAKTINDSRASGRPLVGPMPAQGPAPTLPKVEADPAETMPFPDLVLPEMPVAELPNAAMAKPVKPNDPGQLEFDFNKKARYEDIMSAIEKLEERVILVSQKLDTVITVLDKKKPKTRPQPELTDGSQTG